jgi:Flp pilus assembly protein TadD
MSPCLSRNSASNLGIAHGGLGEYEQAVSILEQAAIIKPAANTEMELGTDLAHLGKIPEATSACDRIANLDSSGKDARARC